MKKIKFLTDYRGALTGEAFFKKGDQKTFTDGVAKRLVEDRRAVYVAEKAKEPPVEKIAKQPVKKITKKPVRKPVKKTGK